jgi:hypothetical protein
LFQVFHYEMFESQATIIPATNAIIETFCCEIVHSFQTREYVLDKETHAPSVQVTVHAEW